MATYLIESEGAPIVPLSGKVQFNANVRVTQTMPVLSVHPFGSPEFEDQFSFYMNDFEQQYKQGQYFSTQDENHNRNRSYNFLSTGTETYDLTISFDIVGAVVSIPDSVSTDLTGQEKEDFLAQRALEIESSFRAGQGWVDL